MIKSINENILFPLRWKYLVRYLFPYLKDVTSVLDLGASCGRLANELSKKQSGISFTGVDIRVQPETFIPIIQYDGKTLPFDNNSFDCVMIIDVLHHVADPESILREARRVSRKYILIKDHYWKNKLDLFLLRWADYSGNKAYGIALPYHFLNIPDWETMIERSKLKIMRTQKFRITPFDPCKHLIYLLEI